MGNTFASNSVYISEGIDIDVSEQCSGRATQVIKQDKVQIGVVDCKGNVTFSENNMWQDVNCNNSASVVAQAKAAAM